MGDTYGLSEHDISELRRLLRKVDGINGPGVSNFHDSITINPPPQDVTGINDTFIPIIPLKLVANETGGGYYKGSQTLGTAQIANFVSTLSEPVAGMTDSTNRAVLVYNPFETGGGHCLSPTSRSTYGAGLIVGTTTETTPRPVAMWLGEQRPNVHFGVDLTQTGGTAGDSSNRCSFTYTVKLKGSASVLGTAVAVEKDRLVKCTMVAATKGAAYFDDTGTLKLWDVNEYNNSTACS